MHALLILSCNPHVGPMTCDLTSLNESTGVSCINSRTRPSWVPHGVCLPCIPPGQLELHLSMGGSLLSPKRHHPALCPLA